MKSNVRRYGVAIAMPLLALLLKLLLARLADATPNTTLPFVVFFSAIMISAWYGGTGPALLTTVLSVLLGDYFFARPENAILPATGYEAFQIGLFCADALLTVLICTRLRMAQSRAEAEAMQRSAVEAELRQSRDQFGIILRDVADGITAQGPDGRLIFANDAAARATGFASAEALMAAEPADIVRRFQMLDETGAPLAPDRLPGRLALQGTRPPELLLRFRALAGGEDRWALLQATPVFAAGGDVEFVINVWRDITALRQADAALRESELRFRTMADSAPVLIWLADAGGSYTFVNQTWLGFTGRTSDQEVDTGWADLLHPADVAPCLEQYHAGISAGQAFTLEYRLRRADGIYRWMLATGTPRLAADGEITGFIGSCVDINDLKQSEAAQRVLADVSAELAATLDYGVTLSNVARLAVPSVADYCLVDMVGPDGVLRLVAASHSDPAKSDQVRELRERYPADPAATYGPNEVARSGVPQVLPVIPEPDMLASARDSTHLALLKSLRPCSYMAVPLIARGHILGVITLMGAESERHFGPADLPFAEELARRAALAVDNAHLYQEAQSAIRLRDDLLAMAAHELRTPVTALLGSAQMVQRRVAREPLTTERDRRALQVIVDQGERLAKLVDSLLDLARLQQGAFVLDLQPVDLCAIAKRVVEAIQPTLHRHSLELFCPEEVVMIEGDDLRLEQMFHNLIQNGVKYTPAGGPVQVEVRREERDAVVVVRDQGLGIPATAQDQIFQRFYRAGNIDARNITGFGLGLYIVKEVVTRHRGSISVQSREDAGSTFTVRLPRALPALPVP